MDNQGRAPDFLSGPELFQLVDGSGLPAVVKIAANRLPGFGLGGCRGQGNALESGALASRPDPQVVDDDVPLLEIEAEFPPVGVGQSPVVVAVGGGGNHQGGVGSPVAQVEIGDGRDVFPPETLGFQFQYGLPRQFPQALVQLRPAFRSVNHCCRPLTFDHYIGQAHAVGRENAGVAVDENFCNAQGPGDGHRVLGAGAAEGGQDVFLDVVAPEDGNLADRPDHDFVGHLDEAVGNFLKTHCRPSPPGQIPVDFLGQLGKGLPAGFQVQGLVLVGTENFGEVVRLQASQDQVGVGDRQAAVFAVAHRSRVGAG